VAGPRDGRGSAGAPLTVGLLLMPSIRLSRANDGEA
jgi:hypothetical protein